MKTLEITDVGTGQVLDLVTLSLDGRVSYDTGRAEPLLQTLIDGGLTESEAFEMRTGWSNGYVASNLV